MAASFHNGTSLFPLTKTNSKPNRSTPHLAVDNVPKRFVKLDAEEDIVPNDKNPVRRRRQFESQQNSPGLHS